MLTIHRNEFPLTTFNWVGLDGSQVLSHITPIRRYDSDCTIAELDRAYKYHKNLDCSPESLVVYGHGDGGGGPTPVMLERLRRARAAGLHEDTNGEDLPLVKTGITLSDFFEMTRQKTKNGTILPDWYVCPRIPIEVKLIFQEWRTVSRDSPSCELTLIVQI